VRGGARSQLAGSALVAVAAASWGTWSLFLRPTHLPATVTTPIILLVIGAVTLPAALRAPRVAWDRATVGLVVANAAFDALNIGAFFAALEVTTIEIAVLTHYLSPIVIGARRAADRRVVTRGAGLAAAVALAGLVVILEPWHAPAGGAVARRRARRRVGRLRRRNVFTCAGSRRGSARRAPCATTRCSRPR